MSTGDRECIQALTWERDERISLLGARGLPRGVPNLELATRRTEIGMLRLDVPHEVVLAAEGAVAPRLVAYVHTEPHVHGVAVHLEIV